MYLTPSVVVEIKKLKMVEVVIKMITMVEVAITTNILTITVMAVISSTIMEVEEAIKLPIL